MHDLEPATTTLACLVGGVRDDQLDGPTPCGPMTVADLLDHIDGLALAFALAAAKQEPEGGSQAPAPDGSRLAPDWREQIPQRLAALAQAWQSESAWTGRSAVGGGEADSATNGLFALDELVVHGWDLAVATGQPFEIDPGVVEATRAFVTGVVSDHPDGIPGLFGATIQVPASAPAIDRLVGLTGRDPGWTR